MKVSKSEISLDLDCWVDELSAAQLASYERMAQEHNAIKNALKNAMNVNEGRELFNGEIFQAYSFKGKVLQDLKDATLPPKRTASPSISLKNAQQAGDQRGGTMTRSGRKRIQNFAYLESSDDEDDNIPLAKRLQAINANKGSLNYINNLLELFNFIKSI